MVSCADDFCRSWRTWTSSPSATVRSLLPLPKGYSHALSSVIKTMLNLNVSSQGSTPRSLYCTCSLHPSAHNVAFGSSASPTWAIRTCFQGFIDGKDVSLHFITNEWLWMAPTGWPQWNHTKQQLLRKIVKLFHHLMATSLAVGTTGRLPASCLISLVWTLSSALSFCYSSRVVKARSSSTTTGYTRVCMSSRAMLFREYLLIHMSLTLIKILLQVYGSCEAWEADRALEAWKQGVTVRFFSCTIWTAFTLMHRYHPLSWKFTTRWGTLLALIYEYIFTIDTDTVSLSSCFLVKCWCPVQQVRSESLNRLIASAADGSSIIGIWPSLWMNEEGSWWTIIQVCLPFYLYELWSLPTLYTGIRVLYLSPSVKGIWEFFGLVSCLPGCSSLYRTHNANKDWSIVISNHIIDGYAEGNIDMLHKKNLFSLGEDRFMTTLLLKHFPMFKTKFIPDAVVHTMAPRH